MESGNAWGWVDTHLPQHIILIRLAVAAGLGALIGFERELHKGDAGFRTHILVSVAAALFTILTFEIFDSVAGPNAPADPIRAVEAVTAGIAFLGAGAIFRGGDGVRGLTTGAGMWLAGAVGLAAALGYYLIALAVALLAVTVLAVLRRLAHEVVGDKAGGETEGGAG